MGFKNCLIDDAVTSLVQSTRMAHQQNNACVRRVLLLKRALCVEVKRPVLHLIYLVFKRRLELFCVVLTRQTAAAERDVGMAAASTEVMLLWCRENVHQIVNPKSEVVRPVIVAWTVHVDMRVFRLKQNVVRGQNGEPKLVHHEHNIFCTKPPEKN